MPSALRKPTAIVWQVLGWIAFLLLPGAFRPGLATWGELLADTLIPVRLVTGLFCIGAFYFIYLYLVPKLLIPKRYVWVAGMLLVMFTSFGLVELTLSIAPEKTGYSRLNPVIIPQPIAAPGQAVLLNDPKTFRPPPLSIWQRLFNGFGPGSGLYQLLVSAGAAFALGLAQAWRKEQEQRLATEVAFLRSQINPHFLFNTLNTLYALALAKSDKAPEAVLRLAAIMRYAVAQSGKLQVPLADEMAYLEGYLELQRLRMPPSMELTYDFPPEDSGGFVAPLLLIIPIENAFTHGIGQEAAGKIHIGIAYNAPKLDVIVQNTIPATKTVHESENMGTGLARMKGYLSSHYPARHKLDIQAEPDQYTLTLSLTIDG